MNRLLLAAVIVSFSFATGWSQVDEARDLLNSLGKNFDKLEQFKVDAVIKVDVDFIKIKERLVKISFKKPDVFTFEAEGLALLPKNGMQMEYMTLINKGYTSILSGQEDIGGIRTKIVKVIPEQETEDIILAQMWIDPLKSRIVRMKTYTKKSGNYVIDFFYTDHPFNLPDRLEVNFDISNLSLTTKMMSEFHPEAGKIKEEPSQAKVIVQYSNYRINSGS
jgi:hypothetical protein